MLYMDQDFNAEVNTVEFSLNVVNEGESVTHDYTERYFA